MIFTCINFIFVLFVEIVFQLAHSFSIFSAILISIFAWVVAKDVDGLLFNKSILEASNSGIMSQNNENVEIEGLTDATRRVETETIGIVPQPALDIPNRSEVVG